MCSKDTDEDHYLMHPKSGIREIMIDDKEDKAIGKLFQSILSRYQIC